MASTSGMRKTLLAGAIGNAIEFYDFIVYAYLAGYFAAQFSPRTIRSPHYWPAMGLLPPA